MDFANEASQLQYKLWEKHDITVQPVFTYIYLSMRWNAAVGSRALAEWYVGVVG